MKKTLPSWPYLVAVIIFLVAPALLQKGFTARGVARKKAIAMLESIHKAQLKFHASQDKFGNSDEIGLPALKVSDAFVYSIEEASATAYRVQVRQNAAGSLFVCDDGSDLWEIDQSGKPRHLSDGFAANCGKKEGSLVQTGSLAFMAIYFAVSVFLRIRTVF